MVDSKSEPQTIRDTTTKKVGRLSHLRTVAPMPFRYGLEKHSFSQVEIVDMKDATSAAAEMGKHQAPLEREKAKWLATPTTLSSKTLCQSG